MKTTAIRVPEDQASIIKASLGDFGWHSYVTKTDAIGTLDGLYSNPVDALKQALQARRRPADTYPAVSVIEFTGHVPTATATWSSNPEEGPEVSGQPSKAFDAVIDRAYMDMRGFLTDDKN